MTKVNWTPEKVERVIELIMSGFTYSKIAEILSKELKTQVTTNMVERLVYRKGLRRIIKKEDKDSEMKYFHPPRLPMDDYLIICDVHAPYYSEKWVNRAGIISHLLDVNKIIIVGDLFDMHFISKYYSEYRPEMGEEIEWTEPFMDWLDQFDFIFLIQGNHERRAGIFSDGRIQARFFLRIFGNLVMKNKFKFTNYDSLEIGEDWLLTHAKDYSRIPTRMATRLASKYHRNLINAHGHFFGMTYDVSGKFLCIDLGGLFDISKIEYINLRTTSYPFWKSGFGVLKNGFIYLFHDGTDWDFWLSLYKGGKYAKGTRKKTKKDGKKKISGRQGKTRQVCLRHPQENRLEASP
jgi:hypothetical protein